MDSRVYAAGEACMQGRRPTMEDAHTVVKDAAKESGMGEGLPSMSVFIIFDGHAGSTSANLAANELWREIVKMPKISKADKTEGPVSEEDKDAIADEIIKCVEEYDTELLERCRNENISDGCTMAGILIRNNDIYCFNAGDSRSVIGQWIMNEGDTTAEGDEKGETTQTPTESESTTSKEGKSNLQPVVISKALSEDHKPTIPREYNRITSVGGRVSPTRMRLGGLGGLGGFAAAIGGAACGIPVEIPLGPDRVWPGGLALSRALGDLPFKDLSESGMKDTTKEDEELKKKEIKELIESRGDTDAEIVINSLKRFGITHQLVVPTPDVSCVTLSDVDMADEKIKTDLNSFLLTCSFLIVACDGLWDVMGSAEAAEFVAAQIHDEIDSLMMLEKSIDLTKLDLTPVCVKVSQSLVQEAYFRNSQDNISCIVVVLRGQADLGPAPLVPEEEPEADVQKIDEHKEEMEAIEEKEDKRGDDAKSQDELKSSGNKFGKTINLHKYFNPKDPSEPSMLPEIPVSASPIEDDPESWGIIALPYGVGLM